MIELSGVTKSFGSKQVLRGIDLRLDMAAMETGLNACGAELGQHLLGVHCLPSEALRPSIS